MPLLDLVQVPTDVGRPAMSAFYCSPRMVRQRTFVGDGAVGNTQLTRGQALALMTSSTSAHRFKWQVV